MFARYCTSPGSRGGRRCADRQRESPRLFITSYEFRMLLIIISDAPSDVIVYYIRCASG